MVCVTQADHVFGVFDLVEIANSRLSAHEGLETVFSKALEHIDGWDVGVFCGSAFMGRLRKNGRGHATDLVIREWDIIAQLGSIAHAGCEHKTSWVLLRKPIQWPTGAVLANTLYFCKRLLTGIFRFRAIDLFVMSTAVLDSCRRTSPSSSPVHLLHQGDESQRLGRINLGWVSLARRQRRFFYAALSD
jgi:hypothetical protein